LAAGAVVALGTAAVHLARRRDLLGRLALDRDAYVIPEVARHGQRPGTERERLKAV
jgi:hypothetical protein